MRSASFVSRAAIIAAVYAALTVVLAPLSYGQIQVRVSEALTVLAYLEPAAIPGLFIGVVIANLFSPSGPLDVVLGSLLTLVAAYLTWKIRRPALALLPPVILNAFGVAFILWFTLKLPYWLSVVTVGAGEAVAVYALGLPLLMVLLKTGALVRPEVAERKQL